MAINYEKNIDCVCDDCGASGPYTGIDSEVTFADLEQEAREDGWRIEIDEQTLCPDCDKRHRRQASETA